MEARLIECVPNFSEGKDPEIIKQITRPIRQSSTVTLLDIDMGSDFNRTVVTMVGDPEEVLSVVIECTIIAAELIDMRNHKGSTADVQTEVMELKRKNANLEFENKSMIEENQVLQRRVQDLESQMEAQKEVRDDNTSI